MLVSHLRSALRRLCIVGAVMIIATGMAQPIVGTAATLTQYERSESQATAPSALTSAGPTQVYLPVVRSVKVAPPNTPKPPAPPTPPLPPPPGGIEPVVPDWVSSCPANTVPFEEQAWWINDFGHVHAGFCALQNQTISGQYTFNVRLVLMNNPGTLRTLRATLDSTDDGSGTTKVNLTCPVTDTCAWSSQVTVDTSAFPYDGWHQIRVRAIVAEPDGKELVASSFLPVYLSNGKPRQDLEPDVELIEGTTDYIAGRGWYTSAGYAYSVVLNPPTADQRIKGVYNVAVRSAADSNPQPVSRFIAKLDATPTQPGTVLYDVPRAQQDPVTISIDTTKLANGWHSLLVRTEAGNQPGSSCPVCSGQPQIHAGVTKVWFNVQN